MSNELARREPVATLPEKIEWAKTMAESNLLPAQYRKNPANLLFAVEYADALGVSRINAITSIHVIEGKPSASADLIASMVRRAGHKLRITGDETYAAAELIRCDDPEFTYKARWDLTKARQAGLLGKAVWKAYPGAMLRSRVITEVARMGASDALLGVIYTPEELGAEVDDHGDVVHTITTVAPPRSGSDRMRQIIGNNQASSEEQAEPRPEAAAGSALHEATASGPDPEPEAPVDSITSHQIKKLATAMSKAGITDRVKALEYVADVIGREVSSRNELTKDEASRVIDHLERPPASEPPEPDDEVFDAEVVPEGDDDADLLWEECLKTAGELGAKLPQVTSDFEQRYALNPSQASASELRTYLEVLKAEGIAA